MSYRGKRALDLLIAIPAVVATAPVMASIAVLVRWRLGSPILFRQVRPGLDERPFTILKFRTMTDERDVYGTLLPDPERLTPLGRALRASSLDELPELLNVLRGEMSVVGPRPLLPQYLDRYSARERQRHRVKPGITGLAQVSGRNALPWPERLEFDAWYAEHASMALDLKILVRTAGALISRRGIAERGQATMSEFQGSRVGHAEAGER